MPTRARFGRLPRSAPSLTSTIVSLAEQYQADRDRNIETAWKSGGLFEGKKVTDEMFLNHWKERLAGVSQDDPMWDYYNNLIYSYQFTIEESKMGQKYAEESVSDAEMAAFYRKWANKMPMNSQNYRQLMTQAAKFKAASTSRGYGRSSQAAVKAYNARQQRTYNEHEAAYDTATALIARYAVDAGYLDSNDLNDADYGWSKLTNATGENDPSNFADLLSDIGDDPRVREAMTAIIKRQDPHFSGTFTEDSLALLANNARNGALTRARRARKAGDTSGASAADKAADNYAKSSMVIRATLGPNGKDNGFVEQNEAYRAEMDAVLAPNSGASPTERAMATQRYANWLAGDGTQQLMKSFPAGSFDPLSKNYNPYASGLMGRIKNTYNALNGKPTGQTLKDDTFGFSTAEAGAESDAVKLGTEVAGRNSALQAVAEGKSIVVRTDPTGKVDPSGSSWSIFDRNDPELAGKEMVPFATPIPGVPVGEVRYSQAVPVKARVYGAVDARTGQGTVELKPNPAEDTDIGSRIDIQGPGGTVYTLYGVYQNGQKVWTYVDPFSVEGRGNEGRDADGSYAIAYHIPGAATGGKGGGPTPYNPSAFVSTTAAKRNINGIDSSDGTPWDPQTDKETGFLSPMAALANSSSDAMKFVVSMGEPAVTAAETEWYAQQSNWTPEMKALIAQGVDPKAAVAREASKLLTQVQYNERYGFTPEDQQANRSREAAYQAGRGAAMLGTTPEQVRAQNERADLARQLEKWGIAQRRDDQRYVETPTGLKPVYGPPTDRGMPDYQKKGWNLGDLLAQPGMSTQQANDLAWRISHGAVGQQGPATTTPNVTAADIIAGGGFGKPHPELGGGSKTPYQNPYAAIGPAPVAPRPLNPGEIAQRNAPKPNVDPRDLERGTPKPVDVRKVKADFGSVGGVKRGGKTII